MDPQEMERFAAFYQAFTTYEKAMHTKAAATGNTAQLLFGDGGLFAVFGLDANIISSYVRPDGISSELAARGHIFPTVIEQPVLGLITGIQDDGAAAVANPCDNAPTGYLKACNLFFQSGRLQFDTATIEFDKVFTQLNAGVLTDLRLMGRLLGLSEADYPRNLSPDQVEWTVYYSEMVKVGMLMARGTTSQMGLTRQNWQGDPANNTAGGGYKEYPGLDSQITTGIIDAQSGTACPAVDSDVKDMNYASIYSTAGNGIPNIVWYLSTLEDNLTHRAVRMGLDPVDWVIVMRPELWTELTQVWPIAYNTNRGAQILGTTAGNVHLTLDATTMTAERDAMRRQKLLAINGRDYRVVTDDGIAEQTNINNANVPAGSYASPIYMVPLTINGNFPVTYLEYYDYRVGMEMRQRGSLPKPTFWTDGGMFSWSQDPTIKWCEKFSAKTERRIVLRSPALAGRINNILYQPLQHYTDNLPGSPYAANGGVSTRPLQNLNAVWES